MPKKLLSLLTKWVNMLKGILHQGGKSLGAVCVRVLCQSSVSHACIRPFCPTNYKRLQNIFNVVTNKGKTETQNALCNFSKSPHMCKLLSHIVWCIMRLVHFCPYINCLRLALVGEYSLSGCFMRSWLVWALSAWERERVWRSCVFVSVDVKYIIHYRRICKFICSL